MGINRVTRFGVLLAAELLSAAATSQAASVIWDNGADPLFGILSSQIESRFDAQVADDFQFPLGPGGETTWTITDVHWDGGYANPAEDGDFDIRIMIYADNGAGAAPTGGPGDPTFTALYVEDFTNDKVNETFTGIDGFGSLHYSYSVDLTVPFVADAGTKYWLAIQSVAVFPPQWGWAVSDKQQLHESVYGFPLLLTDYWTSTNNIDQIDNDDVAFRLTGFVPEPGTGLLAVAVVGFFASRQR